MKPDETEEFAQALDTLGRVMACMICSGATLEDLMDAVDDVLPAAVLLALDAEKVGEAKGEKRI